MPKLTQIRTPTRPPAAADDIAGRFRHGDHSALIGIGIDIPAVTVGRHRQRFIRSFSQHDRGVTGLIGGGVGGTDGTIVLYGHPSFRSDIREGDQRIRDFAEVSRHFHFFRPEGLYLLQVGRLAIRPVILRSSAAQYQLIGGDLPFPLPHPKKNPPPRLPSPPHPSRPRAPTFQTHPSPPFPSLFPHPP